MDGRAEVFVMMMDGRWAVARGRMEVQAGGGTTMLSLLYAYSGRFVCRVCCVLCGVCCVVCAVSCVVCAVRCIFVKCMYTNTHRQGLFRGGSYVVYGAQRTCFLLAFRLTLRKYACSVCLSAQRG